MDNKSGTLHGRKLRAEVKDGRGRLVGSRDEIVDDKLFQKIKSLAPRKIMVQPFVTFDPSDVEYLPADEEEKYVIAQANIPLDELGQLLNETAETRAETVLVQSIERDGSLRGFDNELNSFSKIEIEYFLPLVSIFIAASFLAISYDGDFKLYEGTLLLITFSGFLFYTYIRETKGLTEDSPSHYENEVNELAVVPHTFWLAILLLIIGFIFLIVGSERLVKG